MRYCVFLCILFYTNDREDRQGYVRSNQRTSVSLTAKDKVAAKLRCRVSSPLVLLMNVFTDFRPSDDGLFDRC